MGIKFIVVCTKCGTEVEQEIIEEGNTFLGIAENGFVIRATQTFPEGWKGVENKIMCSYCVQGKERPGDDVEIVCERCKKVNIILCIDRSSKKDVDFEIRKVTSSYEFVEFEPMKFYCCSCAKEVKNEKASNDSSATS